MEVIVGLNLLLLILLKVHQLHQLLDQEVLQVDQDHLRLLNHNLLLNQLNSRIILMVINHRLFQDLHLLRIIITILDLIHHHKEIIQDLHLLRIIITILDLIHHHKEIIQDLHLLRITVLDQPHQITIINHHRLQLHLIHPLIHPNPIVLIR